jgi:hypothetical protein
MGPGTQAKMAHCLCEQAFPRGVERTDDTQPSASEHQAATARVYPETNVG